MKAVDGASGARSPARSGEIASHPDPEGIAPTRDATTIVEGSKGREINRSRDRNEDREHIPTQRGCVPGSYFATQQHSGLLSCAYLHMLQAGTSRLAIVEPAPTLPELSSSVRARPRS